MWLRKNALLKPERIKTKNVNFIDVDFLGYDPKDVGRVAYPLNKPPSQSTIEELMRRRNVKPGSKEWNSVLERRQTRDNEWLKEASDREKWIKAGDEGVEEEWKWNWEDNEVDPVKAGEMPPRTVKVRLKIQRDTTARRVLEVSTDGGKTWRSVTGDVDTVALTGLDGRPLPDDRYGELLEKLRGSDVGAEHPTTDTWVRDGEIWFKAKEEQLAPGECCFAEFGPDGEARAVSLDLGDSRVGPPWTRKNFRLFWRGGYRHTMGWDDRLALGVGK